MFFSAELDCDIPNFRIFFPKSIFRLFLDDDCSCSTEKHDSLYTILRSVIADEGNVTAMIGNDYISCRLPEAA